MTTFNSEAKVTSSDISSNWENMLSVLSRLILSTVILILSIFFAIEQPFAQIIQDPEIYLTPASLFILSAIPWLLVLGGVFLCFLQGGATLALLQRHWELKRDFRKQITS